MNKKYIVVDFYEVFTEEFVESLDTITASNRLQLVLSRIEQYELKHHVEFVSFYQNSAVIFKNLI